MDTKVKPEQTKRRACDECRSRKLACTKESDGCGRCKRQDIKCVYSPQKRMGRPRKHRAVEPAAPVPAPAIEPLNDAGDAVAIPGFEFDSAIGMDLDLSFFDMNNTDVNFLDLVDPNSEILPEFLYIPDQTATSPDPSACSERAENTQISRGAFWPMNDHLGDINFDPPTTAPPQTLEFTPDEVARLMSADRATLAETPPALSPPSTSSPSARSSAPEPESPQTRCSCLAALYLALDSLQTLPAEVGEAMMVARTAAKTAHDTILCPVCGDPPLGPTCAIPVSSIQSMMMLGALLPSLSDAYMRILGMVDGTAAAADAERRTITFTLRGYGGIWGWMANQGSSRCGGTERLEGAKLEPVLWRLTVRALLKLDVYGINEMTASGFDVEGAKQPGLKDIIHMMEERSRRRHALMDQLMASGAMPKPPGGGIPFSTGEKPTCMRIIDIAKRSMDDLIIP
ncbi:hypothetical protein BT67DRAFT_447848 [Trichocladium antarcticum]|uniref:Zn(2)-C6 fungal-type domain-containing protein n=1 Tax=Trichocladium antarcticum TaxID=1450529 RepID=A0AAN6UNT2_9PEZI|nr:hypothetical protein BT67DRAFT_447848 [Trichocladium antarcticum]